MIRASKRPLAAPPPRGCSARLLPAPCRGCAGCGPHRRQGCVGPVCAVRTPRRDTGLAQRRFTRGVAGAGCTRATCLCSSCFTAACGLPAHPASVTPHRRRTESRTPWPGRGTHLHFCPTPGVLERVQAHAPEKRRKNRSAAQRKEQSARMNAYWTKRRRKILRRQRETQNALEKLQRNLQT